MAIAYRFTDDGLLEQQDTDGVFRVHTLEDRGPFGNEKTLFDTYVEPLHPIVARNELRTGVPSAVIKAIIFGETGGKPDRFGPTFDGGVGAMMITSSSLKGGYSNQQLIDDVELNIEIGSSYLAKLAGIINDGYDPVKLASAYNSGSLRRNDDAPWGYNEYRIPSTGAYPYISKVVRAYNYAMQQRDNARGGGGTFSTIAGAVLSVVVLVGAAVGGYAAADPSFRSRIARFFT